MPSTQLPPCGIGGASNNGGPCSGTYMPSQAGQDSFSKINALPVASAIIAAGFILAGVLFALWAVYKVGRFFGHKKKSPFDSMPKQTTDEVLRQEAGKSMPDAEFSDYGNGVDGSHDDSDAEDDAEDDSEDDSDPLMLGHAK